DRVVDDRKDCALPVEHDGDRDDVVGDERGHGRRLAWVPGEDLWQDAGEGRGVSLIETGSSLAGQEQTAGAVRTDVGIQRSLAARLCRTERQSRLEQPQPLDELR